MNSCNEQDFPKIAILLATYEPNLAWLEMLLASLNVQTYPNLQLYVIDDCSKAESFKKLNNILADKIQRFPFTLKRNLTNIGSDRTFQNLTTWAEGNYFAYCDQDDIWNPDKLFKLYQALKNNTMAYCDMSVIDANGLELVSSLCMIRPRLKYWSGKALYKKYLFTNCTAGCSMLVAAIAAKRAIPFPEGTVWDQWVCAVASFFGSVAFVPEPLVQYRQHENNQTGILKNIESKSDYQTRRIHALQKRVEEFDRRFGVPAEVLAFTKARVQHNAFDIWKYRKLSKFEAYFEIAMRFMPEKMFRMIVNRLRGTSDENTGNRRNGAIGL